MSDTELLDALERFIDNNRGLVIHHEGHDSKRFAGLGLACTGRTLRQALQQSMRPDQPARGVDPCKGEGMNADQKFACEECELILRRQVFYVPDIDRIKRLARAHLELLTKDDVKEKVLHTLRTDLRARLTDEQNAANPTSRDKIRFISDERDELRSQKAALESHGSWRIGGKVPLNVYEGDRPMFQCHTPEDASRVVSILNATVAIESQLAEARNLMEMAHQNCGACYEDPSIGAYKKPCKIADWIAAAGALRAKPEATGSKS